MLSPKFRWIIAIAMVLLLQACSNSKFLVSLFYNKLDNSMLKATFQVADFTSEQKATIRAMVGTFHVWHRQSELPAYAVLMADITRSLAADDFNESGIKAWLDEAEAYSLAARECLPINFSVDLMKTLSDEQIDSVASYFAKEREEDLERLESRTPEEQIERRLRNATKWAGRIDLTVTATQRAILRSAFERQISLRSEYLALSDEWQQQFLQLLRQRNSPQFDEEMSVHIEKLWSLLETNYPEQWQANRDLWKETTFRIAESMTDDQRRVLGSWLKGMSGTLLAISKYEPSFKVGNDPSLGCLVPS